MSATPPVRRANLTASYRDLSERQIRARLEGELIDAERVTARAELLRRGIESDQHDTTPATGFAATGALDLIEAAAGDPTVAAASTTSAPRKRGVRIGLVGGLLAIVVAAVVAALGHRAH